MSAAKENRDGAPDTAPGQGVEAVERALRILDCFGEDRDALTLKQLADATGLYKSTILRLAASLERFGYLRRLSDGRYQLGATLWRLGALYRRRFDVGRHVRPILDRLSEETGESASFYVRDGSVRVCLFRRNSRQAIRHHLDEGAQLPLERGAAGRLILAYTGPDGPEAAALRVAGHAVSVGERDPDTASVSVPVFSGGQLAGALTVSGLRTRFDAPARARAIDLARAAARELEALIDG